MFLELLERLRASPRSPWAHLRPAGGRRCPLVLGGELVTSLGVGLVPLAFYYVAPAVCAQAFSLLVDRPDQQVRDVSVRRSGCAASVVPDTEKPKPTNPVGRLAARLSGRFLFRSGPPADATDGGLFATVPAGAEVRGGWGLDERRRARRAVAVGAALAAGASAVLLSRTRQVERLARALRR